ncbi:MAG: ABC-F family ATP-binding cassette domain-containing protein, partial [Anaerolineales bacterium]
VNTIWEMTPALEIYHGNYSAYLQQRGERYQRRLEEYQAQQALIEKEEEFIRRNLAGQNTRQAQGRRKRLERLLEESRLTPPQETRRIHLKLQPVARSGDLVLRTNGLSIGYADEGRPLFSVPDLILQRGECAAILGPNGAGKTTFLKTLLGQVPPFSGEVILGASLRIGYFAQAHESLHPERTLMQEIEEVAPKMLPAEIRNYLAKFLFSGDDVFKTVETLSGGERSRLALACLALQGANLLLLDEPTNHLDLPSQEALQAVLAAYQGTILLVSHDRYLIDALATQIWEVMPDEAELRIFDGTYSEYKAARQTETAAAAQADKMQPSQQRSPARPVAKTSKETQRKHRQRIQALEEEIAALEAQMAVISRRLEHPPADPALVQKLGQEYVALERALEQRLEMWDTLTQQEYC